MTVVLAMRCEDGLVLATDSQITDTGRGMSYPAQKLHSLGDHAAWGGSGARGVLTELEEGFEKSSGVILDAPDVDRALQEFVVPVLRHHYENFIEHVPGEKTAGTPSAYVLAVGYAKDAPFIIEINPNGMVSRYDDIGFHAVGSGDPMAQQACALLAHFRMTERSVEHGVVAAVRVLDALRTTSPRSAARSTCAGSRLKAPTTSTRTRYRRRASTWVDGPTENARSSTDCSRTSRTRMFENYLSGLDEQQREALRLVIEHVARVAPDAVEGRSYGVPAFRFRDKPLLGFAASKSHLSLYPFSPAALDSVSGRLAEFDFSNGTVRFTVDHPLPEAVLADMVQARSVEIERSAS